MAISIISTINSHNIETTGHEITMPSNISEGNLLIVFFTCDGSGITISKSVDSDLGWNILTQYSSSEPTSAILYKMATIYGSNDLIIETTSVETSTAICYNISGTGNIEPLFSSAAASSTNANPPSIVPVYGTQTYLFLVYAGILDTVIASVAPTDFSGLITEQSDSNGASSSSAYRLYSTNTSYNPGVFTSSSAFWVSFTVCISPIEVYGIGFNNIGIYEN
jgi:hypothetical protein